jgi:hypothetical protein
MDLSTLTYWAPATEPAPIAPIRVDGMAYRFAPWIGSLPRLIDQARQIDQAGGQAANGARCEAGTAPRPLIGCIHCFGSAGSMPSDQNASIETPSCAAVCV